MIQIRTNVAVEVSKHSVLQLCQVRQIDRGGTMQNILFSLFLSGNRCVDDRQECNNVMRFIVAESWEERSHALCSYFICKESPLPLSLTMQQSEMAP